MFVDAETPSGTINGVNAVFTLAYTPSPAVSLLLALNGLVQRAGVDFVLSGLTITYQAGCLPLTGDTHVAWYRTLATGEGTPSMGFDRDTIVALIQNRLGQRTGLAAQIIAELNFAQGEMEGSEPLPWFLAQAATATTVANIQAVQVPTDFLRELEDSEESGTLWLPPGSATEGWTRLYKGNLRRFQSKYIETGKPRRYTLTGNSFLLFPTPDAAYALVLRYFAAEPKLDANIKNGWTTSAPDLLTARAGLKMAQWLRDPVATSIFMDDLKAASVRLATRVVSRAVASTDPRFGNFEDDEDGPVSTEDLWWH